MAWLDDVLEVFADAPQHEVAELRAALHNMSDDALAHAVFVTSLASFFDMAHPGHAGAFRAYRTRVLAGASTQLWMPVRRVVPVLYHAGTLLVASGALEERARRVCYASTDWAYRHDPALQEQIALAGGSVRWYVAMSASRHDLFYQYGAIRVDDSPRDHCLVHYDGHHTALEARTLVLGVWQGIAAQFGIEAQHVSLAIRDARHFTIRVNIPTHAW